ncbi:MAG: PIN domain-containing protein [Terracidiphilus sp.]|jgi:predicted nucleic acid-binding protein
MIIFDASYLVVFLNKNPEPAKDRQGNPVTRFKERVEYLASSLNSTGEQIGIPTPAMAEVLVRSGKGRAQFVSILSDRMRFQLLPFDARGAIEAAELIALIKSKHETWGTHAKVKFDIQIVATAKAEDATAIYSDDQDIENFAKRLKIPVMRICDLPVPPPKEPPAIEIGPSGEQAQLFDLTPPLLQPKPTAAPEESAVPNGAPDGPKPESVIDAPRPSAKTSDEREANSTHPAPVRGSDEGRAEGEAAGEAAKQARGEPPAKE